MAMANLISVSTSPAFYEEDVIDRDFFTVVNGLDEVLSDMCYLRHNNPAEFKSKVVNIKEIAARATEILKQVGSMDACLKREGV
jgi:hypothetical protein